MLHCTEVSPLNDVKGHSRRLSNVGMSASPLTPDVGLRRSEPTLRARYRLMRCSTKLFDHVVGKGEQLVGHGKAERLCGLEVDHQLELDWGLDGQSSSSCP